MVWGREQPQSFINVFGQRDTFGMLGFRQQAQQSTYPFYSPFFTYSDYSSLSTNEVKKNGSLANSLRNSSAALVQGCVNNFLISARMLEDQTDKEEDGDSSEKNEEKKEQETKSQDIKSSLLVQCGCIGLSSAIAAAVSHPLAVVATWQMVQDIPVESKVGLSVSRVSAACRAIMEASDAIKSSKKSYYDGLMATVSYSVLFEVTKFGFSKKLNKHMGIETLSAQIEHNEARSRKEGNNRVRGEVVKRSIVLRWRRLALSGYLNYVASVGAGMLWYPLETIALRMQAQGSSFRFPTIFSSPGEVIAEQGVISLYSGAPTLLLSFLSETAFAALTYFFVIVALEFLPNDFHESIGLVLSFMEQGQF